MIKREQAELVRKIDSYLQPGGADVCTSCGELDDSGLRQALLQILEFMPPRTYDRAVRTVVTCIEDASRRRRDLHPVRWANYSSSTAARDSLREAASRVQCPTCGVSAGSECVKSAGPKGIGPPLHVNQRRPEGPHAVRIKAGKVATAEGGTA